MSQNVQEPSYDRPTQRPNLSGVSALTMALQVGNTSTHDHFPALTLSKSDLDHSGIAKPISISPSSATPFGSLPSSGTRTRPANDFEDNVAGPSDQHEGLLRDWCTGLPPKKSYLSSRGNPSPRLPFTRRSTLADKPELDTILAATKQEYNGEQFLPLTARTIHQLSPYWKGEKPIADTTIFKRIMIGAEINVVHADHVVAALKRIGGHCAQLVIFSSVQTSDLGGVFNREAGNVESGNDWVSILKCFPHLKHLAFVCQASEPAELSRGTLSALRAAGADRLASLPFKGFTFEGPVGHITL
jgi:hypothetical protein